MNHWIWAGGFLALSFGGITLGAVKGIESGRAAMAREMAEGDSDGHAEAIQGHGEPSAAHGKAGPGHGRVGDPEEALRHELRSAIFLGRQGQFEEAEAALERLVHRYPERASLWLNIGVARVGAGKLEAARTAFEKVLAIDPNDWDAVAELAILSLEQDDLDAALREAGRIPPGKGRMTSRLARDPRWTAHAGDPRVAELREKHGLDETPDASERLEAELQARRAEAAEAPTAVPASPEPAPPAPPPPEPARAPRPAAPAPPPSEPAAPAAADPDPIPTAMTGDPSGAAGEQPSAAVGAMVESTDEEAADPGPPPGSSVVQPPVLGRSPLRR